MKSFMNTFVAVVTSSRFKSFYWRGSAMIVVSSLSFTASNLDMFNLSSEAVVFAGLVLGEITKSLNNILSNSK